MKEKRTMKYSKKNRPETNPEAVERAKKISEDDIDFSDIPEISPDDLKNAILVREGEIHPYFLIDGDVLDWFKAHSSDYHTHINSVLRHYIQKKSRNEENITH